VAPKLLLIIGSTRPNRFADKPVAWILDRLKGRDDFELKVLDLRDHPLPMYESAVSPARSLRDYPTESIARLGAEIDWADGFIIVSSEYNHGYPAVLKNALDSVFVEFNRKPVAFVSYGSVGGGRVVEQLRLVAVELEMAPLRHAVHILPDVMRPAMMAESFSPAMFESLDARLEMVVEQLLWWTIALSTARNAS
jgi:NAD(P)H-dependent FMN reductase